MERGSVKTRVTGIPEEILALGLGKVDGGVEIRRTKGRTTASTDVEGAKGVSTGDFSWNEEVVLAEVVLGAFTRMVRPVRHEVDRDLGGLVDTNTVNVERLNSQAPEHLDLVRDPDLPFSETVLDGGEFSQLTLPIGADRQCGLFKSRVDLQNTESFDISILVKVTGVASSLSRVVDRTVFEPEGGVLAGRVVFCKSAKVFVTADRRTVVEVKVRVVIKAPWRVRRTLPLNLVFVEPPGSGRIEMARNQLWPSV